MRFGVRCMVMAVTLVPGSCRDAAVGASDFVRAELHGTSVKLYVYRPEGCKPVGLLLVFHGAARNASSARDAAAGFAERHCLAVYAPELDKRRFPNWKYQGGGVAHNGTIPPARDWSIWIATDLISWARKREGQENMPFYLFGHSAGAQFLSRVAAYGLPADARRIVIANPSTYVLPTAGEMAPFGFGGAVPSDRAEAAIKRYLALPITIFLGEDDIHDKELAESPPARAQGENRLTRGRFVFERGRELAAAKSWRFQWKLVLVPGIGHDTSDMLDSPQADRAFSLQR